MGQSKVALPGKAFADRGRKGGYPYGRTRIQPLAKPEIIETDKVYLSFLILHRENPTVFGGFTPVLYSYRERASDSPPNSERPGAGAPSRVDLALH